MLIVVIFVIQFAAMSVSIQDEHNLCSEISVNVKKYLDITADPCTDFYQFSCGNFAKHHPIPEYKGKVDAHSLVEDKIENILRSLLDGNIQGKSISVIQRFYKSCLNEELSNKRGAAPALDYIKTLGGWPVLETKWQPDGFLWVETLAKVIKFSDGILIRVEFYADLTNTTRNLITLVQNDNIPLFLLDFQDAENSKSYKAYNRFIKKSLTLFGVEEDEATLLTQNILNLEKIIKSIQIDFTSYGGLQNFFYKSTVADLKQILPNMDWETFLSTLMDSKISENEEIALYGISYFENLAWIFDRIDKRMAANYIIWKFLQSHIKNLDQRFLDLDQDLSEVLYGIRKKPPRWKECMQNFKTSSTLGNFFVEHYFDENQRSGMKELIKMIQRSFKKKFIQNNWLSEETKKIAVEKIDGMRFLLGHENQSSEEELKDVDVSSDEYFENCLKFYEHDFKMSREKLKKPFNKDMFYYSPVDVATGYVPTSNSVSLPAGILQPPFYHASLPNAFNFGAIGMAVAHEITHAFDEKGRLYDASGVLRQWWDQSSETAFSQLTQCLVEQYQTYKINGYPVNGRATLQENLCDNIGLQMAFDAYSTLRLDHNDLSGTKLLPGLNYSSTQLFYISFAQSFCTEARPEEVLQDLKVDPHAPSKLRVIGTLSNSEEFAHCFNCKAGSVMNPSRKCHF